MTKEEVQKKEEEKKKEIKEKKEVTHEQLELFAEKTKKKVSEKAEEVSQDKDVVEKSGTPEEQKVFEKNVTKAEQAAQSTKEKIETEELSEKMLIYQAKLEGTDLSHEDKDELRKTLQYIESGKIEEDFGKEVKGLADSLSEEIASPEQIEKLSQEMGLPKEVVQQVFDNQRANIEAIAMQRLQAEKAKKTPRWKRIFKTVGKMGLYIGGGIGLSVLTGGIAAGAAIGGARLIETYFGGKRRKKEMAEAREKMREFLKSDSEETRGLKAEIQANILAELAVAKQEQIEGKEKQGSALGQEIQKAEESYARGKIEREDLELLYGARKDGYKDAMRKYLEERGQGLSVEEMEKRVQLAASLVEMDDNNKIVRLEFGAKNKSFLARAAKKMEKILAPLAGGKTEKQKLATAGVFAFAGVLARTCPVVRNLMMAYAGVKVGEVVAGKIIGKAKRFEILRKISVEELEKEGLDLAEVDEKTLSLAKTQLLDEDFKKENPAEYARFREQIFAIERAKIKKSNDRLDKANQQLRKTVKEKISKEKQAKILKGVSMVTGGVGGFFIGDALENLKARGAKPETKPEAGAPEAEVAGAETPEISPIETVGKGDNVWKLVERQLEKRGAFENLEGTEEEIRAQKDFMIDALKDKVVAAPGEFGLKSVDLIKSGQEINLASLFKESGTLKDLEEAASGLSKEALKNISQNREFLGKVLSQSLDKTSDTDLAKAYQIMGGGGEAGPAWTEELNKRVDETTQKLGVYQSSFEENRRELDAALAAETEAKKSLEEAQKNLQEVVQGGKGPVGWFKRTFLGYNNKINEATTQTNKAEAHFGATQNNTNNSAARVSESRMSYEEQVKRMEILTGKRPPELKVEARAPETVVPGHEAVSEAPVPAPEATEGVAVASLEQASAEHPLVVEGAKIFQEDGKLIVDQNIGPDAVISRNALGGVEFRLEEPSQWAPLTGGANKWLVENQLENLGDLVREKGLDETMARNQLGMTFNTLRDCDNILKALKEANLGDSWQTETVRGGIRKAIKEWVSRFGPDGAKKIFQESILKEYNLIEQ